MIKVICPCGTKIIVIDPSRIGRTKYCSKKCFYQFRTRPRGLTYNIVSSNAGWFKEGNKSWNYGLAGKGICKSNSGSIKKGERRSISTEFFPGSTLGPKNKKWKDSKVGYFGLHSWIYRRLGKANKCENCGKSDGRIEWANKSHEYLRRIEDWIQLCKKCHGSYDKGKKWGCATKKFNLNKKCV